MNKYFVIGLFLLLGTSLTVNFYLVSQINQDKQTKERIRELVEKREYSVSMELETIYTDSVNNVVYDWLGYGTSNE